MSGTLDLIVALMYSVHDCLMHGGSYLLVVVTNSVLVAMRLIWNNFVIISRVCHWRAIRNWCTNTMLWFFEFLDHPTQYKCLIFRGIVTDCLDSYAWLSFSYVASLTSFFLILHVKYHLYSQSLLLMSFNALLDIICPSSSMLRLFGTTTTLVEFSEHFQVS